MHLETDQAFVFYEYAKDGKHAHSRSWQVIVISSQSRSVILHSGEMIKQIYKLPLLQSVKMISVTSKKKAATESFWLT